MGKNRSRANILQQLLLEHNFKNCQSLHGTSITYNVVHQLHFSFVLFFSFKKETRSGGEQNNLERERNNQVTKEKLLFVKFTPPSGYLGGRTPLSSGNGTQEEKEPWDFPVQISKELEVVACEWKKVSGDPVQHMFSKHLFNTHAQDWAKAIGYLIQSEVKSEREKQTWYINTCIWNLEKCYRPPHFQGRNRDTDAGDGHVDVAEVGVGAGRIGRWGVTHTPYRVLSESKWKLLQSDGRSAQGSVMT